MADAADLKSEVERRVGSNPISPTIFPPVAQRTGQAAYNRQTEVQLFPGGPHVRVV